MMKTLVKIAGVALLALGLSSAAEAAARIGVLRCQIQGGAGFVVGSSHPARCIYKGDDGKTERYAAKLNKFGVDLGVTREVVLVWAVFAPSALRRHALAGDYVGGTATVSIGIGGGANALIGGNAGTVSLQPLSLTHETGVAVAAGVGELSLR
jgi:Protein of unknown function (DUF992)